MDESDVGNEKSSYIDNDEMEDIELLDDDFESNKSNGKYRPPIQKWQIPPNTYVNTELTEDTMRRIKENGSKYKFKDEKLYHSVIWWFLGDEVCDPTELVKPLYDEGREFVCVQHDSRLDPCSYTEGKFLHWHLLVEVKGNRFWNDSMWNSGFKKTLESLPNVQIRSASVYKPDSMCTYLQIPPRELIVNALNHGSAFHKKWNNVTERNIESMSTSLHEKRIEKEKSDVIASKANTYIKILQKGIELWNPSDESNLIDISLKVVDGLKSTVNEVKLASNILKIHGSNSYGQWFKKARHYAASSVRNRLFNHAVKYWQNKPESAKYQGIISIFI
jgi:hypothetical protein